MIIGPTFGGGHVSGFAAGLYGLADEGLSSGHRICPVNNGFTGWENNDFIELTRDNLERIVNPDRCLIVTGSPRVKPSDEDIEKIVDKYKGKDVVMAVFGGDDNLGVAARLMEAGIKTMGWDKTMDNDKNVPQVCFGYHSFVTEGVEQALGARDQAYINRSFVWVGVFCRDADFVPGAIAHYGLGDLVLGGEKRDKEISIDHLKNRMAEVLDENERKYGVRFGTGIFSEGAVNIEGYADFLDSIKEGTQDMRVPFKVKKDAQGHPKLQPELLGIYLNGITSQVGKGQFFTVTYTGRNKKPTDFDRKWGEEGGREIVRAINEGDFGKCAVLDYNESRGIFITRMPLEVAAQKRLMSDVAGQRKLMPIDYEKNIVTEDMGKLWPHIFGERPDPEKYTPKLPKRFSL